MKSQAFFQIFAPEKKSEKSSFFSDFLLSVKKIGAGAPVVVRR